MQFNVQGNGKVFGIFGRRVLYVTVKTITLYCLMPPQKIIIKSRLYID